MGLMLRITRKDKTMFLYMIARYEVEDSKQTSLPTSEET